ncbi:substrate-binding domain-containing protein [Austwickia chelonae]|uniref:substrate-binding domain-containing protein n=1 Tax=Austwickia chelonae TaxID=100225 RepID=UPI000E24E78D|nr:sugar-binding protein [Austwickia chelonae]
MRSIAIKATAVSAVALLALTACGNSSRETGASAGSGTAKGFPADAMVGVALPDKTSENWVLAGKLFEDGLKEAGFKADVQYAAATNTVADQQNQIQAMVTRGAKVIFVGAKDGSQLGTQAKAAKDAGAIVVAYDRLLKETPNVDYYLAYDNRKVGQLQGKALLEGMKSKKADGPYTIELFAGSPDDANSQVFFDGAMDILKPEIEKGSVVIGSGQKDFKQATTEGWKAENAQRRMDTILTSTYAAGKTLDGVLSPNDTLARAVITSARSAGKPIPIVTGQDSEVASVQSIMKGEQYSTINKDTRNLVKAAIDMAKALQKGQKPAINNEKDYDNKSKIVPAQLLDPHIVTKANAAEEYANDPNLASLTK